MILAMGLLLGVYVGAEILVGDWAATFLQRVQHLDQAAAATSVGLYWGGITAGRLLSAVAARRYSGETLLVATCLLSLLASVVLPIAPNVPLALAALTLSGLGYAAVFPLVMAVAGERFPEFTGSVAGLLIAAASICGTAFPWLAGVLVQYADARAALALAVPACVVMVLIALMLARTRPVAAAPLVGPVPAGH
jgi:FHS family glucose/mannose:H+ symporter-like MFS transporter